MAKKIENRSQANKEARRLIANISETLGLTQCEVKLQGCLGGIYLAPAHRHKRTWYKGDVDSLSDYRQWVCACQNCHNTIENNAKLTEEIFINLRGKE